MDRGLLDPTPWIVECVKGVGCSVWMDLIVPDASTLTNSSSCEKISCEIEKETVRMRASQRADIRKSKVDNGTQVAELIYTGQDDPL